MTDRELAALRALLTRDARRLAGGEDEAEDLVQECLIVLVRHRDSIRDADRVSAWCRAVLRNLHRQRRRRKWYAEQCGVDDLPDTPFDPWHAVDARLTMDAAASRLPDRVGGAMRRFYFDGDSIGDIARATGRPGGTVKRWLHEGREALRMMLTEGETAVPLARIYGSHWGEGHLKAIIAAAEAAGLRAEVSDLADDGSMATDAALMVFGDRAGERTGLELLLCARAVGVVEMPVLLFGAPRRTAVLAAWQAGADAYLADPSSPDLPGILQKLCEAARNREAA